MSFFFLGKGQLKLATEQEKERGIEIEALRQEKDDLAVKLTFTENILKVWYLKAYIFLTCMY